MQIAQSAIGQSYLNCRFSQASRRVSCLRMTHQAALDFSNMPKEGYTDSFGTCLRDQLATVGSLSARGEPALLIHLLGIQVSKAARLYGPRFLIGICLFSRGLLLL